MDQRHRPQVHAARGVRGEQQRGAARQLARRHQLLLVAAREPARLRRRVRGAHVVLREPRPGVRREGAAREQRSPAQRGLALEPEHQVLGQRHLRHHAAPQPVARNVRDARRAVLARGARSRPVPEARAGAAPARRGSEADRAGRGRAQPGEALHQLLLPVPRHPGDPHHLARPHRERHVAHRLEPAVVAHREPAHLEPERARRRVGAPVERRDRVPHHELGDRVHRHPGHRAPAHHAPRAHHRDAVRERLDLGELVRDQHHRGAGVPQRAQHLEQLVHLLRREHRGGLVEDQHARAVSQRLEDLDALLGADRQRVGARAGFHR